MPSSFHTKTIEQILDPVASQVSELVVLHEKGEGGAAIPNLEAQIQAVKAAVTNLAAVGNAQVQTTKDEVLRIDTPPALKKLVASSDTLLESTQILAADAYSKDGRVKLISGARGILQGTSDVLLIFDEAEVRRICHACQGVREYLKVSEVVAGMEDLVQFVKNISPGMTNMTKMVSQRASDLTNQIHAEKLERGIKSLREQLPNFLSSIKLVVATVQEGGKSHEAATSSRLYYVKTLSDVITEIIKYLQLLSSDQDLQADPMKLLQLNQTRNEMANNIQAGKRWLRDESAKPDSPDKLALLQALDSGKEIGGIAGKPEVVQNAAKIAKMVDKLSDLRTQGRGGTAESRQIAGQIDHALDGLLHDVDKALDEMNQLGKAYDVITQQMPAAKEWLADPRAAPGAGSAAVTDVTRATRDIVRSLPADRISDRDKHELLTLCDEIDNMMQRLNDYRKKGEGQTPEARALSKQIADKLGQLNAKVAKVLAKNATPRALEAKLVKAEKWLDDLTADDEGMGARCTRNMISDARRLAQSMKDAEARDQLLTTAAECEKLCDSIDELVRKGLGDSSQARTLAGELKDKLAVLKRQMKEAMVEVVADEFADCTIALKQLNAAALAPLTELNRGDKFESRADTFQQQATRLAALGTQAVSLSTFGAEDKLEQVELTTRKLNDLTPQVVTAGRIVLEHPENELAKQHFDALKEEWTEHMDRLTEQVDNSVDVAGFIKASEKGIAREREKCVAALDRNEPLAVLPSAGNMAKRAQRILVVGKREVENTDDQQYVAKLKGNLVKLNNTIPTVVEATRGYVQNPSSDPAKAAVIEKSDELMNAVSEMRTTVEARLIEEQLRNMPPPPPESPPPIPPLPEGEIPPPIPPLPVEEEEQFPEQTEEDEAMMRAARELHDEAKKWESQGNNIIAAAKRMAVLMAKMSSLVRGEGKKSDLISCAKEIAKASAEVTKLAKEVANKCTDKRIRNDMMKTLDRIPTISTQLRILSTVKAASLGDSTEMSKEEEDAAEQATEMLVHNAQNLMMSVKDTVRYAEAASIRIRTDAGLKMRWVRKNN